MPQPAPGVITKERLAALKVKIDRLAIVEQRERCRESLHEFVKASWHTFDSAPFQDCFAIEAMCLPYDSKIATSDGIKTIGEIVESNWQGNVLSFNHKTSQQEWKPIVARMQSEGKPLLVINNKLRLTDNHPVYVVGRGYIRASQVKVGDVIGTNNQKSAPTRTLELQELWQAPLCASIAKKGAGLLFDGLLQSIQSSYKRYNLFMRQAKTRRSLQVPSLLGQIKATWKNARLQLLWQRVLANSFFTKEWNWNLLQQEMFWAFDTCGGQFVSSRVRGSETHYHSTRKASLFSLLEKKETRCASYRSQHQEQRALEPSSPLREVSCRAAHHQEQEIEQGNLYEAGFAVVDSVERDLWVPDIVYNIEVADNHNYYANSILVHNCEHLEAVTFGQIPKLLINVPPRCSKTTIVSIIYPAWTWARGVQQSRQPDETDEEFEARYQFLSGPDVKFLCASYSDKLVLESSTKFRRLVQSDWYQRLYPLKFMKDQNTKGHMDNDFGGSRQSTSVGGTLLGLGGAILIGDDLNNTEKGLVETGADRERAANFWSEFHSTRRNDPRDGKSAVINVQQRVHQTDVSGVWLDSEENVVHLMIPMRHDSTRHCVTVKLSQYDDDDKPWEDPRDPDGEELMWPERFGEFEVRGLEKALGPYQAAGRLQQSPTPKGGGIIQRAWWQPWDQEEAQKYGLEWSAGRREFPHFELIVGSLDTAFKEKEENDFNALTIWGIFLDRARNRRAMLMYAWQKRKPLHGKVVSAMPGELPLMFKERQQEEWGLIDWIADSCKRYKVKRLLIEDKSRGHDVANEIRRLYARENWGVQLLPVVGDKVSRTHSVVPLFTDDCIYAPDTKWAEIVIANCEIFPKGAHDDMNDSVTQFLNWAREAELLVRADEMSAANEEAAAYKKQDGGIAAQYGVG